MLECAESQRKSPTQPCQYGNVATAENTILQLSLFWFSFNFYFFSISLYLTFQDQGKINCGVSSQADFVQNYFLQKRMFRKQTFCKNTTFSPFWPILGPIWSLFDFNLTRSCAALGSGSLGQDTFHMFLWISIWNCYLFVSHQLYVSCQKVLEHVAKI